MVSVICFGCTANSRHGDVEKSRGCHFRELDFSPHPRAAAQLKLAAANNEAGRAKVEGSSLGNVPRDISNGTTAVTPNVHQIEPGGDRVLTSMILLRGDAICELLDIHKS